jgi:hypothetical protein
MALNLTVTGNIVDELENPIEAYYDVYYVRQGVLVSGLVSELQQYNFNAGAANHLTQDGEVKANDVILVRFNTNADTLDYSGKFAAIAVVHDGSTSTYVIDVQLKSVQMPACNWNVDEGTINNSITLDIDNSLDNSWPYGGNTMYQREYLYAYAVYPGMKLSGIEYNFDGTWVTSGTHTYTSIGDKTVSYRSTLFDGSVLECSKSVRIRYNDPIACIGYEPASPKLGDEVTVTGCGQDVDSRVTSVEYVYDGVIEDTNIDLAYSFSETLDTMSNVTTCQKLYWNDGFEDKIKEQCVTIAIENQPPVADYTYTNSGAVFTFEPDCSDVDGTVVSVKWVVMFLTPLDGTYKTVYDSGWVTEETTVLELGTPGDYKVRLTAKDDMGATGVYEEVVVNTECGSSGAGKGGIKMYFDKE